MFYYAAETYNTIFLYNPIILKAKNLFRGYRVLVLFKMAHRVLTMVYWCAYFGIGCFFHHKLKISSEMDRFSFALTAYRRYNGINSFSIAWLPNIQFFTGPIPLTFVSDKLSFSAISLTHSICRSLYITTFTWSVFGLPQRGKAFTEKFPKTKFRKSILSSPCNHIISSIHSTYFSIWFCSAFDFFETHFAFPF